jgi:hypothetical protein
VLGEEAVEDAGGEEVVDVGRLGEFLEDGDLAVCVGAGVLMMVLILLPYCLISFRGSSLTATTRCVFTITPLYTFANEPSPRKSLYWYSYSPFFSVFIAR